MMPWNDPKWVGRTPIITAFLLEGGNAQQLWRMWSTHTSAGQSISGWLSVNVALCLWLNFYRVLTPQAKAAFTATAFGIVMNAAVVLTTWWLR